MFKHLVTVEVVTGTEREFQAIVRAIEQNSAIHYKGATASVLVTKIARIDTDDALSASAGK